MGRLWMVLAGALLAGFAWARPTIVLDPGHPSEVGPGTRGQRITEMQAAWRVSQRLRTLLEADGYRVVLTKQTERQFVRNRDRARIANRTGASLMLRLHCDAAPQRGFATFYADRPGTAQGRTGPTQAVLGRTRVLAKHFHRGFAQSLRGELPNRGLRTDRQTAVGARYGALIGSIFSDVPSVLVEMVVLTDRRDERWLLDGGIEKMAQALRAGVRAAIPRPTPVRKRG